MDWSASVSLKTTVKSFGHSKSMSVQNVANYGSFTNSYGMKKSKSLEFRIPQSIPEHQCLHQFSSPGKLRDAARAAGENNNYWMQQRAKLLADANANTNTNGGGGSSTTTTTTRKRRLDLDQTQSAGALVHSLWRNRKSAALACSVPLLLVVVFVVLLFCFPASAAVEVAVASGSSTSRLRQPAPDSDSPCQEIQLPSESEPATSDLLPLSLSSSSTFGATTTGA